MKRDSPIACGARKVALILGLTLGKERYEGAE